MAQILLIEDDDRLRSLLSCVLQRAGHTVVAASGGQKGLDLAHAEPPDLVVTDLVMPDTEGLETIIELRQDFPDLPIIAMSGAGLGSHYLKAAAKLGATLTLAKPFTMEAFVEAVEQVREGADPLAAERPLAFVVLDDDDDSRFLNRYTLKKSFPGCVVHECDSVNAAVEKCTAQAVDAVLADHHLRGESGLTLVWRLRHQHVKCPILMVTSSTDIRTRESAYAGGVTEVFSDGKGEYIPYLREFFGKSASAMASSFHPSLARRQSDLISTAKDA
jgi:CheY-like chemotaxis protein